MPKAHPARQPRVTDHAVLRWMERYMGFDIEAVRASILTPERREAIECGASAVHCRAEGVTLIISEDGTIKTVLPISRLRGQDDKEAQENSQC